MKTIALVLCAMLPCAAPVSAQAPEALEEGTTSIAFTLPDAGSSSAGVWRFLTDRDALGLIVSVRLNRHEATAGVTEIQTSASGIGVGPAYKHYLTPGRRVAPYVRGEVSVHRESSEVENERQRTRWGVAAASGVGVDWFPVEEVSIGGFVGLQAGFERDGAGGEVVVTSWRLNTLTSALTAHVYF